MSDFFPEFVSGLAYSTVGFLLGWVVGYEARFGAFGGRVFFFLGTLSMLTTVTILRF